MAGLKGVKAPTYSMTFQCAVHHGSPTSNKRIQQEDNDESV